MYFCLRKKPFILNFLKKNTKIITSDLFYGKPLHLLFLKWNWRVDWEVESTCYFSRGLEFGSQQPTVMVCSQTTCNTQATCKSNTWSPWHLRMHDTYSIHNQKIEKKINTIKTNRIDIFELLFIYLHYFLWQHLMEPRLTSSSFYKLMWMVLNFWSSCLYIQMLAL